MRNFGKNFLIKFTILFCFIWIYVVFLISKKYNVLLNEIILEERNIKDITIKGRIKDEKHRTECKSQETIHVSGSSKRRREALPIWSVRYNASPVGMNLYTLYCYLTFSVEKRDVELLSMIQPHKMHKLQTCACCHKACQ